MRGNWGMGVDLFGPGAKLPPGGGVELAGVRQWVKSLLALPVLFVLVVVVCGLAGLKNWLVVLIAMSSLTVIFEALLLRGGAPASSSARRPLCGAPGGARPRCGPQT